MNQNVIMLVGRVADKPQLKPYKKADGSEGYRCFFRCAVTRLMDRGAKRENQRTNWIPIVAWGEQAKRHAQYLDKGTEVTITGELIVETNRKEDGSFGPDFVNVQARDIQYGQSSLKNASVDTIQRRKASLEARLAEIHANMGAAPAAAPSETPATPPTTGGNPFTKDGEAPAAPAA